MKRLLAMILALALLCAAFGAAAETAEKPLFATLGEAEDAGKSVVRGSEGDQYYAVALEKDGKFYRAVAELDDKARELDAAIMAVSDVDLLEAAFKAYDDYLRTLPVKYVEEFAARPKTQAELDALAGKTVADLLGAGFEISGYGSDGEKKIVIDMNDGIFEYAFTADVDYETFSEASEKEDYGSVTVTSAAYTGLSSHAAELRYHADGTVEELRDPFAEITAIGLEFEEAVNAAKSAGGAVDYQAIAQALAEKYPDQAEYIQSIAMVYQFMGADPSEETAQPDGQALTLDSILDSRDEEIRELTESAPEGNETDYRAIGLEAVSVLSAMVGDPEYLKLFTYNTGTEEIRQEVNTGDYDRPVAVYSLKLDTRAFLEKSMGDEARKTWDSLSETLQDQVLKRVGVQAYCQPLISSQAGMEKVSFAAAVTAFVGNEAEPEKSLTYLYVFEKGTPVLVTFGWHTAGASFLFLAKEQTASLEDLQKALPDLEITPVGQ